MWRFLFAQTEEAVPAETVTSAAQQAAQQTTTSTPSPGAACFPDIGVYSNYVFLMIRPQQKRGKERGVKC
jgi:hypothetical protein